MRAENPHVEFVETRERRLRRRRAVLSYGATTERQRDPIEFDAFLRACSTRRADGHRHDLRPDPVAVEYTDR
ncbi:Uncharacterised protein [Mycobacteroides abscessus subsp. abscessus]|nr:Uncharacterised protein [Mycobacteroides abscessus subsp. abscessus]